MASAEGRDCHEHFEFSGAQDFGIQGLGLRVGAVSFAGSGVEG